MQEISALNDILTRDLSNELKSELEFLNQYLESLGKDSEGFLGDLLSYVLVNSGKRIRPTLSST